MLRERGRTEKGGNEEMVSLFDRVGFLLLPRLAQERIEVYNSYERKRRECGDVD